MKEVCVPIREFNSKWHGEFRLTLELDRKPLCLICSRTLNLLKPTGYVTHEQFNLLKPTGYVTHQQINLLKPTDYVTYQEFNIQQL